MSDRIINTTTIILGLLFLTVCIMIYNYFGTYTYVTDETNKINISNTQPAVQTIPQTISQSIPQSIPQTIPQSNPIPVPQPNPIPVTDNVPQIDASKDDNTTAKKQFQKSLKPETGITKLAILHMNGCGHCRDLMEVKQSNGMTKFEQLEKIFEDDQTIQVMDFKAGRDEEASKYTAFPIILIITGNGETEYMGYPREVKGIAKAVLDAKYGKN